MFLCRVAVVVNGDNQDENLFVDVRERRVIRYENCSTYSRLRWKIVTLSLTCRRVKILLLSFLHLDSSLICSTKLDRRVCVSLTALLSSFFFFEILQKVFYVLLFVFIFMVLKFKIEYSDRT